PARDRRRLLAEPVPQRAPDGVREDDLELVGGQRQRLDLEARPLERGGDLGRERIAVVHRLDASAASGWNQDVRRARSAHVAARRMAACAPTSSTTTCPPG